MNTDDMKKKSFLLLAPVLLLLGGCAEEPVKTSQTYELGEVPNASDFTDGDAELEETSFEKAGTYKTYILRDGEKTPVTVTIQDTTPPKWEVFEKTVYTQAGKKPDYNFSAKDESGDVTITIDDSKVDFETPGEYQATATAEDASGNQKSDPFTVSVQQLDVKLPTVTSHVTSPSQKKLADDVLKFLQDYNADDYYVVADSISADDWNNIYNVDYAVCDAMGWEYMDITDGFANSDNTYQISVNPKKVKDRAVNREISNDRLKNMSDKAGITASTNVTEKAAKIKDFIIKRLDYTDEDIYPSDAVQLKKGNSMTYSQLFKQLADYNKIPADYVTGYLDGEYHSWNRVWINGQPKWIDLVLEKADPGHYFMSETLWPDHSLSITESN